MKYRWNIINYLIQKFKYQSYLEIGVDQGQCFNQIIVNNKISVDPGHDRYKSAAPTYQMTSDDFFSINKNSFDIIFIDGLHHSDQVDKDIENSLKCLTEHGIILIHDCNPESEIMQKVPRESRSWTGDVWKSIVKYRSKNDTYGCVVLKMLPDDQDLGLIKKGINSNFSIDLPDTLTYFWLDQNREDALGLVNTKNFLQSL